MIKNENAQKGLSVPVGYTAEDMEISEQLKLEMEIWSMGEDIKRLKNEMKEVKKLLSITKKV